MRQALLVVSEAELTAALRLPAGARIAAMATGCPDGGGGLVTLLIIGDGLPDAYETGPGESPRQTRHAVTLHPTRSP